MKHLLSGGTIVDGTRAARFVGDVLIDGDRVAAVAPSIAVGEDVARVDCTGKVVAPGFIDPHTHYDAQILWDPALTPSAWHGVTTVVLGNCGFGLAPCPPDRRGALVRTLESVEGMDALALEAGVRWEFESFPEYLDAVERSQPGLNVAAYVGHTPVRQTVLGADADRRPSTPQEVATIRALVRDALAAGAVGFATDQLVSHVGEEGRPVASRLADRAELEALTAEVGAAGRVFMSTLGPEWDMDDVAEQCIRHGIRGTWSALLTGDPNVPYWRTLEKAADARARGADLWTQVACRPLVLQIHMDSPFVFDSLPAFTALVGSTAQARHVAYADESWRAEARSQIGLRGAFRSGDWSLVTTEETGDSSLDGRSPGGLDELLDIALAHPSARFTFALFNNDPIGIGELLRSEITLLGLSDAGAHASQICDAGYATELLGTWVRDQAAISLEHAVWRLTGHPAQFFGLDGRGTLTPGAFADVVVFDAGTVACSSLERVYDLPAGRDRLVAHAVGIERVFVNGTELRSGNERTGRVIRR
jgi:N-acyl-D-aspartate/D-glutamate deacylase